MSAPRRYPTRYLAALGALQNLLKRPPPIPHRQDRSARRRRRKPAPDRPYRRRRFLSTTTECRCLVKSNCNSEACFSRNTARPDIRQSPVESFQPTNLLHDRLKTSRTTRSKPGLLMSLHNSNAPILGYPACHVNPIRTYHRSQTRAPRSDNRESQCAKSIPIAGLGLYGELLGEQRG